MQRRWISAFDGLTLTATATALDSGRRRNDGNGETACIMWN
jgi:hypothetical protein